MFAQLPAILLAICSMLLFTYREQNRVKRYNDDIAALRDAVVKQQHIISALQIQVEMSVKVGSSGYVFGEGVIPKLEAAKEEWNDRYGMNRLSRAEVCAQIDEDIKWRKENPTTLKVTKSEYLFAGLKALKPGVGRASDKDLLGASTFVDFERMDGGLGIQLSGVAAYIVIEREVMEDGSW